MQTIHIHFLDTSALVKLVVRERGSDALDSQQGPTVRWTTTLCVGEALGVLKAKRFFRDKEIDEEGYFAACEKLLAHIRDNSIEIEEVDITAREVFDEVENIARTHSLDAIDSFQLVTLKRGISIHLAREAKPMLVTADGALEKAAEAEGLRVWNCLNESSPNDA